MSEKTPFVHKLLSRFDRVDSKSLKDYLLRISCQNELLWEVLQHLNEGLLIVTEDKRLEFANQKARLMLDLDSLPDDLPSLFDVISDHELSAFLKKNLESLKEKKIADIDLVSPEAKHLRVFLLPLNSLEAPKFLILISDRETAGSPYITDEQLARIASLVSLAAGIAHEIGNPLNAITIHLELMKKDLRSIHDPKKAQLEKSLNVISSETKRLDKIVRNFLKATRKPPIRFQNQNLNQILEDALNFLVPELKTLKIALKFKSDMTLPEFLMDRERLYQAFLNLIKNAMEAMDDGGTLTVHVSHKNKIALIQFKDTGKGIEEKDLPHIFDAYYTTKDEGSGLGLMTVYESVRAHNGQIQVQSKVGRGTTFTLMLPIRQPKLQLPQYKIKP